MPPHFSPLTNVQNYGLCKNFSASNLVKTGGGNVIGVIVNSHSSGTLKLEDALTDTTPLIINTFSFPAGSGVYSFFGAKFITGLYAVVGGTLDCTIVYN